MKIGDFIRKNRIQMGLSQAQLAEKCGWESSSRISNYENNSREPILSDIIKLAEALNMSPKDLIFPTLSMLEHEIPIISWDVATNYCINSGKLIFDPKNTIPASHKYGENTFALKIKDDSMTCSSGSKKSFVIGEYIIIDPDRKVRDGDFVLAYKQGSSEVIFRHYIVDADTPYLFPLNTQRKEILVDKEIKICGVLIATYIDYLE